MPSRAEPGLPLLVIVGPTAVGKTDLSIRLAERLEGEIVSADSRCLYRGLDIGTAKPSPAEQQRVRHHLIDVAAPDEPWTLATYQAAALAAIDDIQSRGRLPMLVGGTGQYIRAVVAGWQAPAVATAAELRSELEALLAEQGAAALARRLSDIDPESASVIDLRNPRRVIRALEVALATGRSFVAQRRQSPPPFVVTTLGLTLPRAELYARIDARVDTMLAAGLVDEVRALAARGYAWDLPAMSGLGYKQIGAHLRGQCDLPEAVRRIRRETRRFVRRQANWFKPSDPAIHWFDARAPLETLAAFVAGEIQPRG